VTQDLTHTLDALASLPKLQLCAAFGPQHGLRGDKQDNMIESPDYIDPQLGIPVFSLYGEVRRPTVAMMDSFDVLLIDLQDLGCRIYTFITTLRYMLEAAVTHRKSVWILDRPNPAGRPIEGLSLRPGWESFVGAGIMPMRHGLTLGELAHWFVKTLALDIDCQVIKMQGWEPEVAPGYGWPLAERTWINFGAPDIDARALIKTMYDFAPAWLTGCRLRECWFEPTFHKHAGQLCSGVQIHVENTAYQHNAFRPWRLQSLAFKVLRQQQPDYPLWRDFAYEYENEHLAIDVINGSSLLREWVDDAHAQPGDLDVIAEIDEQAWEVERKEFLLY
jgi:uncharacterized protein YbbC (DUF1343 family)